MSEVEPEPEPIIEPIPPTSRQRYLSGIAALNLIAPEGTGDWHMIEIFFRPHKNRAVTFIAGEGCATNTIPFLGDAGVFDCTSVLNDMRIAYGGEVAYAANHARAIADLVIGTVLRGQSPEFVIVDDWMPRDSDKQKVYDLLDRALPQLSPEHQEKIRQWRQAQDEYDYH
jgi:hypothetical protein